MRFRRGTWAKLDTSDLDGRGVECSGAPEAPEAQLTHLPLDMYVSACAGRRPVSVGHQMPERIFSPGHPGLIPVASRRLYLVTGLGGRGT